MKLQDAIDWFEGNFTCEMGAPWRWADLGMTKPYDTLQLDNDVASAKTPEEIEHRLATRMINQAQNAKDNAGFRRDTKPKLFWRWQNKVRMELDYGGSIIARFYIDGNPGFVKGNPQLPGGQSPGGQMKLLAAA